jgi:hypothetical protein
LTLEAFEKHMTDTGDSLEKLQDYSKKYAEEVRSSVLQCPTVVTSPFQLIPDSLPLL